MRRESHATVSGIPGAVHDGLVGLHYNYFRDYDPAIGRYVQSDPIGLDGGINTYGYALQNPLSYVDPRGELAWWLIPAGILAWEVTELTYDYYQFYSCVKQCPTECTNGDTGPNAACKAKCLLDVWASPDGPGPKWPMTR